MSNYTSAMVARIQNAAPLNLAKANEFASEFVNVTHRSVISKAQSLGVEYVKASPKPRQSRGIPNGISRRHSQALALPVRRLPNQLGSVLESIG